MPEMQEHFPACKAGRGTEFILSPTSIGVNYRSWERLYEQAINRL